ncbi:hypothetical protein [Paracoccus aerius]|uniref:Peptidylprolyl isomerase n=3 Tax=Paracoccus aerius TaxID=1915382 RepID=A0ABS1SC03_9RHOB|nr:hypothetical protein [Paracoccus aerius]MBL3675775.1 hypothetical protein [Paracoccus aerius]
MEMAFAAVCAKTRLMNSATIALLSLPFWAGALLAQETPSAKTQEDTNTEQAQPLDETAQGAGGQSSSGAVTDGLLATIGGVEIRNSDLLTAVGALPPPLTAHPPEIVASLVLQQLLLREAIVQKARSQNLAQDPEVQSLVSKATQAAEKHALVQVWLQRELESRVTPESVEQAYAALQAVSSNEVPPLEQLRQQLEEGLRRQAFEEIETSLLTGADITFYGPDGKPRSGQQATGDQNADGAAATTDQPQEGATNPASTAEQTQAKTGQTGGDTQTEGAPTAPAATGNGTGGAEITPGN